MRSGSTSICVRTSRDERVLRPRLDQQRLSNANVNRSVVGWCLSEWRTLEIGTRWPNSMLACVSECFSMSDNKDYGNSHLQLTPYEFLPQELPRCLLFPRCVGTRAIFVYLPGWVKQSYQSTNAAIPAIAFCLGLSAAAWLNLSDHGIKRPC